jgi:predicted signal transduction protein with EAL and GGDEF domain
VLGRPAPALVHPDQADALHAFLSVRLGRTATGSSIGVRLRDGFDRWRETEWTASGDDPAEPGSTLVVHVRDLSGQGDLREALSQAAYLDHQTSLANRRGLQRAGDPVPDSGALIVLDLGGLTAISDLHGADLAEAVLVDAARRLRHRVAEADVPARIGDTRFAVLTRGGAVRAHLLASQLINVLTAPYNTAGTAAHLSAWAGLTDLAADEAGMDEVIRRATLAMRSVRSGPPGAVEWYDEEMEGRLLRRSTLEQDLPGAVSRGGIDLTYQPIVELPGRRPVGVEAVPGWRHPTLGPVPAGEVLALAEDLGLLGELSRRVLHQACRELVGWRRQHESLWLSVPVRPRALTDPVFQAALDSALELPGMSDSALVVEIAEVDLLQGADRDDVAVELGSLRTRGIRTAVGHFGAGPTSLSRLRTLPIDLLKIDRDVFGAPAEVAITDATVALGRRLGMEVIAQGLLTEDDLSAVQAAGCRLGQGDLVGRAMPAERMEALLEQHRSAQR